MTWATMKAAIAAKLETLAITSPETLTIARVYQNPPATITDSPCIVLFPPAISPTRIPGNTRRDVYKYRGRLFVYNQDKDREAAIIEAFSVAVLDLFDDQASLRAAGLSLVNGPEIDEAGILTIGSRAWSTIDMIFELQVLGVKTFG